MPGALVPYPGTDAPTYGATGAPGVIVDPPPAGGGVFPIPAIVSGNNDVTADDVAAADQANRDAIVWLTHRTIDWVSGGDYRTLSAQLLINNPINFYGTMIFEAALVVAGTGTLTILSGGISTFGGPVKFTGASAWQARRKSSATGALAAFAAEETDTLWCYSASSDYIIKLTDPNIAPLPEGIRCRFVTPSSSTIQVQNSHTVTVEDHNSVALFTLAATGQVSEIETVSVIVSGTPTIKWDRVLWDATS